MQKVISLAAGLCLVAQVGHAQSAIKAGTVALSGSINFTQNKEEGTSNSNYSGTSTYTFTNKVFNFNPGISYFVADNLAIGAEATWGIQETSVKYGGSYGVSYRTSSSLQVGPFARYYHMLTDQFGFTGTLGAGYERNSQPVNTNTNGPLFNLNATGFYAGFTPGLIFLPIPRLGLGASIGGLSYNRLSVKPDNSTNNYDDTISTFGANFGLAQLTFSGTYFFGR